jgi:hypothetical protein
MSDALMSPYSQIVRTTHQLAIVSAMAKNSGEQAAASSKENWISVYDKLEPPLQQNLISRYHSQVTTIQTAAGVIGAVAGTVAAVGHAHTVARILVLVAAIPVGMVVVVTMLTLRFGKWHLPAPSGAVAWRKNVWIDYAEWAFVCEVILLALALAAAVAQV